jgi:hypothetical protein
LFFLRRPAFTAIIFAPDRSDDSFFFFTYDESEESRFESDLVSDCNKLVSRFDAFDAYLEDLRGVKESVFLFDFFDFLDFLCFLSFFSDLSRFSDLSCFLLKADCSSSLSFLFFFFLTFSDLTLELDLKSS